MLVLVIMLGLGSGMMLVLVLVLMSVLVFFCNSYDMCSCLGYAVELAFVAVHQAHGVAGTKPRAPL